MQLDLISSMFAPVARHSPELHWYALADSAMQRDLPAAIATQGLAHCLFNAPEGAPVAKLAPYLVGLASPLTPDAAWRYIARHAATSQALTVVATTMEFGELLAQLSACLEVVLPDGDEMFLAFWDPAILGALLGDADDPSGTGVLRPEQAADLVGGICDWWYWDRLGRLHRAQHVNAEPVGRKIELTQPQVDALVEVSVPDLVLYHIELNQPHLLKAFTPEERFVYATGSVQEARALGLRTEWDFVCYTCMKLIYRDRWYSDTAIRSLLDQVQRKAIRFKDAVDMLP